MCGCKINEENLKRKGEKIMKKMKKVFALLVAMVMVMGMTMTTMAAPENVPAATDTAEVKVSNIEAGATVTAYQIIEGKYNEFGFIGYKWVDSINEGKDVAFNRDAVEGLTSDFITSLAGNTDGLKATAPVTATGKEVTLTLNPGTWMVIVTPPAVNAEKIYNPMIASVSYTADGMAAGEADANDNWELVTEDAYAKSTEMTVEKTADQENYEVGQTVNFTINTTIPSYSKEYKDVVFRISDTIVNGLKYTEGLQPTVTVGGQTVTDGTEYTYIPAENGLSFVIDFDETYIKGLAEKTAEERAVVVSYSAVITEDAVVEVAENEATIDYTRKPDGETGHKEDTEYTFTFELDGEMQKVEDNDKTALAGAEFTLYRDENCTDEFKKYTTTEDGNIKFEGLDADTPQYLKETKAPAGFSLNDHVYKIEIKDIVIDEETGKVTNYTVYVDGEAQGTVEYGKPAKTPGMHVINTKLSNLPSTGGIGTTIFTIGGCVIMIAAAGLFFASRRKESK